MRIKIETDEKLKLRVKKRKKAKMLLKAIGNRRRSALSRSIVRTVRELDSRR